MTLVKILAHTIRKRRREPIVTPWSVQITYKSETLPKWLLRKKFIVQEYLSTNDGFHEQTLILEDKPTKSLLEKVKSDEKATLTMDRQIIETADIFEEQGYYFRYANPKIECNECHKKIFYKDIETGYSMNQDGDEFSHDECPECGEFDSFEYTLEPINKALERWKSKE